MTRQEEQALQTTVNKQEASLPALRHRMVQIRLPLRVWQPLSFALLLVILTTISTVAYYLNYPRVDLNVDTPAYLHVVNRFLAYPDLLVDPGRLPFYPLFIALIYVLAGRGNLAVVSAVQAALFVLMALEVYAIALLLLRRAWAAFLVGLLVGTNLILLSYAKPIMTEGLAAFLLTSLALAALCYIRTLHLGALCGMTACLFLLIFTRPEWLYVPIPLYAYLLLVTLWRGNRHHLRVYSIAVLLSLVLISGCVGAYIVRNGVQNHYQGFTGIENYNELGKILQYNMQDEAPPQDQAIGRRLDSCIARIDRDPYHVLPCVPALTDKYRSDVPAGTFARSIILRHPGEFLLKSLPLFFTSLIDYYPVTYHTGIPPTPLVAWLQTLHRALYWLNACFPLVALAWLALLCWRHTSRRQEVLAMGMLVLLAGYGVIVTTLGAYRPDDYMRVHIVFDPLLIVLFWATLLLLLWHLPGWARHWFARQHHELAGSPNPAARTEL
jgi:hypothetical protein